MQARIAYEGLRVCFQAILERRNHRQPCQFAVAIDKYYHSRHKRVPSPLLVVEFCVHQAFLPLFWVSKGLLLRLATKLADIFTNSFVKIWQNSVLSYRILPPSMWNRRTQTGVILGGGRMIGVIAPYLAKFHHSYQSNDIIDRLNYQFTTTIIALAAFTLAATQYVGKPIQASSTSLLKFFIPTYIFHCFGEAQAVCLHLRIYLIGVSFSY